MGKDVKIKGKTYTFREILRGLDLLASIEDEEKNNALRATVSLISRGLENPKMSTKDILMLPYGEFVQLIQGFASVYGVPQEFDFLEKK